MREENELPKKRKRSRKKKQSQNLIVRFFKILLSIVLAFVLVSGISLFAYSRIVGFNNEGGERVAGGDMSIFDFLMKKDITLNIAMFGVDADGTRTDVMMVAHFDSKTGNIKMLSVPRDTRVTIPDVMYDYMLENNRYIPSGRICKINEIHAYAGKEKANEYSVLMLEELLDIKIDHYIKVDFDGFVDIVDLVDGVDFYVPQDMYWNMSDHGDIVINLKEGMQHLDGQKAQQLVRFRQYKLGDVQRVQVQQDFMKAVAEKLFTSEVLLKKFPDLVRAGYEFVETDISLTDAVKYANYIGDINRESLETETLPGNGEMINGVSYFLHYEDETKETVKRIFYSDEVKKVTDDGTFNTKELAIEVSNGGSKSGFAAENQEMLEKEGYTVKKISTYVGSKTENTKIFVAEDGMGEDLKTYYPNSDIVVSPTSLDPGIDILIVLGENE